METREKVLRFSHWNHQGRTTGASTVLPIWGNGAFRPARVSIIRGKTALLSGMHFVKKLGAAVCFGGERFKVGQGEWDMMTSNADHHLGSSSASSCL